MNKPLAGSKPVVHVIGGGTISQVRPHMALMAEAYGGTARSLAALAESAWGGEAEVKLHLTKMATSGRRKDLNTDEDILRLLRSIVADPRSRVVFLSAAIVDFHGSILEGSVPTDSGLSEPRLKTRNGKHIMELTPAQKVIQEVRKYRKDIFLVGFKATSGEDEDEQFRQGLQLLKESSANLVLANDMRTRVNMVVVPERSRYCVTTDRQAALRELVDMAHSRSRLHFTRSHVAKGNPVPFDSEKVPDSLRRVVSHCVARGAYKPFLGRTEGHFAVKLGPGTFLSSIRKTDINRIHETGMVLVQTDGDDEVTAFGAKPSVGGQSQRIVFAEHPDVQCIVHFHCPMRPGSAVPVRSQREFECGSHECGRNTSRGMRRFDLPNGQSLWAVMLDRHGPNVAFSRDVDPEAVIDFIERNFLLEAITDGGAQHQAPVAPAAPRAPEVSAHPA